MIQTARTAMTARGRTTVPTSASLEMDVLCLSTLLHRLSNTAGELTLPPDCTAVSRLIQIQSCHRRKTAKYPLRPLLSVCRRWRGENGSGLGRLECSLVNRVWRGDGGINRGRVGDGRLHLRLTPARASTRRRRGGQRRRRCESLRVKRRARELDKNEKLWQWGL